MTSSHFPRRKTAHGLQSTLKPSKPPHRSLQTRKFRQSDLERKIPLNPSGTYLTRPPCLLPSLRQEGLEMEKVEKEATIAC